MRVYVCADEWRVLEVFVNEKDAKEYKAQHEEQYDGERLHIQRRELRTAALKV